MIRMINQHHEIMSRKPPWQGWGVSQIQYLKIQKIQPFPVSYLYLRYIFSQLLLMVSVSKYLKDTEDTAPHVSVSVSQIHFKSIFPNPVEIFILNVKEQRSQVLPTLQVRKFCPNTPVILVGCKNDVRFMLNDEQYLNYCRERSPLVRFVITALVIGANSFSLIAHIL